MDHKNQDKLDCRRENLRFCTTSQNNANSTGKKPGLKGVYYSSSTNKSRPWMVKVSCESVMHHIAYFDDETEAAYVYDQVAFQLFGEFASLNTRW